MRYDNVRDQIGNGDLLGIEGNNLFSKITEYAQRISGLGELSPITHIGVAWWVEGRLYSVEMDGKHNVLRPLSQHVLLGCKVNVYKCPVDRNSMATYFDAATSAPIKYDLLELVKIGWRLIFRTDPKAKGDGESDLVCSTFATQWVERAGWCPPDNFPTMSSPAEFCSQLGDPTFVITEY